MTQSVCETSLRDDRDEKCARRLDDMRESDRALSALERLQLARDRFGDGDDFQEARAVTIFPRHPFAEGEAKFNLSR